MSMLPPGTTGMGILANPAAPPPTPGAGNGYSILGTGVAAPQDPAAMFTQQYLDLLNSPGQYVGGSAGYTVSAAPQRAASQAGYNQASANAKDIYGQAVSQVAARDPGIQQGYADATAAIEANARQRAIGDMAQQQALQAQAIQGARALGLSGITDGSGAMARTNALEAAQQAKYQTNADSWAGFNGGAAQRAVAKNDAAANSFAYSGTQAQTALANLLQKTLASEKDVYHAGSAGKIVGAMTPAQKAAGYMNMLNYGLKGSAQDLTRAKASSQQGQFDLTYALKQALAAAKPGVNVSGLPTYGQLNGL